MIDGVIFDMDGVLLDSERLYADAWHQVMEQRNLPGAEACVKACIGLNWRDTVRVLKSTYGADFPADNFRSDIKARFNAMTVKDGLPVKTGAAELLQWLKGAGIPVGLATSTGMDSARRQLSEAGLLTYFDEIVTGDMVTKGKPDPEIYRTACQRLSIRPAAGFAIEDSPNGIRSASGAGLRVIMVPDLIEPTPDIRPLAFKIVDSLLDVKAYFKEIIN